MSQSSQPAATQRLTQYQSLARLLLGLTGRPDLGSTRSYDLLAIRQILVPSYTVATEAHQRSVACLDETMQALNANHYGPDGVEFLVAETLQKTAISALVGMRGPQMVRDAWTALQSFRWTTVVEALEHVEKRAWRKTVKGEVAEEFGIGVSEGFWNSLDLGTQRNSPPELAGGGPDATRNDKRQEEVYEGMDLYE